MKLRMMFCLILGVILHGVSWADVPILRFEEVSSGIYRGARPDVNGLDALAAMGVKTDLDLENDPTAVAQETEIATDLGMKVFSKPMSGFWTPDDQEVNDILNIVADRNNYPLFIHCTHGQDRTGLIVGLYRVMYQGWAPADAYSEMKTKGFHPALIFLNHYFEKKTGYDD